MKKEDILQAARSEKNKNKEYDNLQSIKGDILCMIVFLSLGIVVFLLELLIKQNVNFGLLFIGAATTAVNYLFKWIKLRKIIDIIFAIILIILVLLFAILFIAGLFK